MNKEQWRRKRELKYIGYSTGHATFTWDMVVGLSDVYISTQDPLEVYAFYNILLISGKTIVVSGGLDTRYALKKGWLGIAKKVPIEESRVFFDKPCTSLKNIVRGRALAKNAFYKFKKITLKR